MKIISFAIGLLVIFNNASFCGSLTLIKSGMMKDGGTRCVEYEKDGSVNKCCIDHRLKDGTNEVFIGGYPGSKNTRVATSKEMKSVYDDVTEIMNSAEYKKYSAMTRAEMRALVVINDHKLDEQKMKEHRKATSYRSLRPFKDELRQHLNK